MKGGRPRHSAIGIERMTFYGIKRERGEEVKSYATTPDKKVGG